MGTRAPGRKGSGFVTSRTRQTGLALLCCGLVLTPASWAFFPFGAYDPAGVLRYEKYNRSAFDNNNDGVVDEEEGIPIYIESGKSGFTEAELEIVYEALRVWERVPQSYAGTNVVGLVEDPIFSGQFIYDGLNSIVMQVTETQDLDGDGLPDENVEPDPPEVIVPVVAGGVLGVSATLWSAEETTVQAGGEVYTVGAGTIVDNDIIINASAHRPSSPGTEPDASLLGTLVHELGHFYGLGHTPVNNVQAELAVPGDPSSQVTIVESVALTHSIAGVSRRIGVTPTMYPFLFQTIDRNGERVDGGIDLAPDDMSGIAWTYPRGNQDLYFNLTGEARTRTTAGTGLPSAQIPGAHIVAWADTDNDPATPRVAVFSTLTALFVNSPVYPEREGRFEMPYLWKTMETESGVFNATYTFTSGPMNGSGYERQAPPGSAASDFDSIQPPTVGTNNVFPSEVLHESGNIIDISNKDAGTPFVWDFQRATLVSTETERTIEEVVDRGPMFGDPNDVCILNVVSSAKAAAGGSGLQQMAEGANAVRTLRDGILLDTALGSFVVDLYYSVSPSMARFLLSNDWAYTVTSRGVQLAYWCIEHYLILLSVFLGLGTMAFAYRKRRSRAAGAAVLALALAAGATTADARILFRTTEQLVSGATDIVSGTVTSAESRQDTTSSKIFTDVVVEVEDTAKGALNKQSNITLTQPGGRVGGLVMEVSELPKFEVGEKVVLYLVYVEDYGYVVYNGLAGKTQVSLNRVTQEKTVTVPPDLKTTLEKSLPAGKAAPDTMSVREYMATLRSIARAQEAETAN